MADDNWRTRTVDNTRWTHTGCALSNAKTIFLSIGRLSICLWRPLTQTWPVFFTRRRTLSIRLLETVVVCRNWWPTVRCFWSQLINWRKKRLREKMFLLKRPIFRKPWKWEFKSCNPFELIMPLLMKHFPNNITIRFIQGKDSMSSPIYNAEWKSYEPIWSCAFDSNHMRIGIGNFLNVYFQLKTSFHLFEWNMWP